LLTERLRAPSMSVEAKQVVVVEDDSATGPDDDRNPTSGVEADNLAYVIFTSGSTGTPKGAMNTHRGIVNRIRWMQQLLDLGADDRVLQKTPLSFDVSVWEVFLPLMAGALLVVADPGAHRDAEAIADACRRERITTVHFVPSMLRHFLMQSRVAEQLQSVRHMISSGELLDEPLQRQALERFTGRLYNLYGPTEAAVDVAWWRCCASWSEQSVPIGWPISNVQLHVLDDEMQLAPPQVVGELYIGGVGVGRGYVNDGARTAERFVPNPFVAEGGLLYRTGDLVSRRTDGSLDFCGRRDQQVKLRGVRIELDEIEHVLRRHPAVEDAAVVVSRDRGGNEQLVAYCASAAAEENIGHGVQHALRTQLPPAMVPERLVVVDKLPLLPSGKVDKRVLASATAAPLESRLNVPGDGDEGLISAIAGLFSVMLGVTEVKATSNFFSLGGNSLLVTVLALRLQRLLDIERPLIAALYQDPTPSGVADAILADAHSRGDIDEWPALIRELSAVSPDELNSPTWSGTSLDM